MADPWDSIDFKRTPPRVLHLRRISSSVTKILLLSVYILDLTEEFPYPRSPVTSD